MAPFPNEISCRAHGKRRSFTYLNATALRVCNRLYNLNTPLNNPQVRDCFSDPIQTTLNLGVDLLSGLCGVIITNKSLDREDNYMKMLCYSYERSNSASHRVRCWQSNNRLTIYWHSKV